MCEADVLHRLLLWQVREESLSEEAFQPHRCRKNFGVEFAGGILLSCWQNPLDLGERDFSRKELRELRP
jgi:hypothetical protein